MTPFDPRLPLIAADARVKTCHVYHCWCALKEMGKSFHADAFATFAGLEPRHVTAILAAIEAHRAVPEGRMTSPRGHRLAADFKAPEEWIEWACRERRWPPSDAQQEAEIFANFWQAKAGKDACKLDWKKTWQNWVRNSRRPNGDYVFSTATSGLSHDAYMEKTADLYERIGRTNEAQEIRRQLASQANVIPVDFGDKKVAINGRK